MAAEEQLVRTGPKSEVYNQGSRREVAALFLGSSSQHKQARIGFSIDPYMKRRLDDSAGL
jgi:hypothetical protein